MYLGLTVLGAVIFMCVKYVEYSAKAEHGLFVFSEMFGGYDAATGQLAWFKDYDGVMAGVATLGVELA